MIVMLLCLSIKGKIVMIINLVLNVICICVLNFLFMIYIGINIYVIEGVICIIIDFGLKDLDYLFIILLVLNGCFVSLIILMYFYIDYFVFVFDLVQVI